MKNISPISLLALLVATIALGLTLSKNKESLTESEIDALVDAGIKRKEKAFVDEYSPLMEDIYEDIIFDKVFEGFEKKPETLEELFKPAITALKGLTG